MTAPISTTDLNEEDPGSNRGFVSRRRFIEVVTAGGAISFAGCTGGETSPQETDEPTVTTAPDPTPSPGLTPTGTQEEETTDRETETPNPAEFVVSGLSADPTEGAVGNTVSVIAVIENTGGEPGTQQVEMVVNGESRETRDLTLGPGDRRQVKFSFELDQEGTYQVEVGEHSASVQAVAITEVGGVINEDTEWAKGESPYEVTSTVQIPEDVTLRIEPGVTVRAAGGLGRASMFLLHGKITANGTPSDRIIIDGDGGNATFFDADGSTPEAFLDADYCRIENGGSFWWGGHGGFNLRHSELRKVSGSYIWYPFKDTQNEYDNLQSEIQIEYNTFIDSGGFSIGHDDRYTDGTIRVNIRNNLFVGGREINYGGVINNWASYGPSETVVEYNSFTELTDMVVLKLPPGYDDAMMSAPSNFWGTTDKDTIEGMIYDKNDDINSAGVIDFEPVLDEPHPDTPSL